MTRKKWLTGMVIGVWSAVATLAFAGVAEFRFASTQSGCLAIPYQTTRDECDGYQKEVTKACKDKKFGNRLREVEKLIAEIEDNKRKLEEAKGRNNRSAIPDLEAKIAKGRDDLKAIKADAHTKIFEANECLNARLRVQRLFKDATTSVEVAARADPELKQYADILVAKYTQGAADHAQAIDDVKKAKQAWIVTKDVTVP